MRELAIKLLNDDQGISWAAWEMLSFMLDNMSSLSSN